MPLTILTYNTFLRPTGVTTRGNDFKNQRQDEFCRRFLNRYDILCLQEMFATLDSGRRERLVDCARRADYAVVEDRTMPPRSIIRGQIVDSGLVILTRLPVCASRSMTFNETGQGFDMFARKGVLYALLRGERGYIHVFNTHLQSNRSRNFACGEYAADRAARQTQLGEISAFVSKTVAEQREAGRVTKYDRVYLCGDLNIDARKCPDEFIDAVQTLGVDLQVQCGDAGKRLRGTCVDVLESDAREAGQWARGKTLPTFAVTRAFWAGNAQEGVGVDGLCRDMDDVDLGPEGHGLYEPETDEPSDPDDARGVAGARGRLPQHTADLCEPYLHHELTPRNQRIDHIFDLTPRFAALENEDPGARHTVASFRSGAVGPYRHLSDHFGVVYATDRPV